MDYIRNSNININVLVAVRITDSLLLEINCNVVSSSGVLAILAMCFTSRHQTTGVLLHTRLPHAALTARAPVRGYN
jgi:hypothetical protein